MYKLLPTKKILIHLLLLEKQLNKSKKSYKFEKKMAYHLKNGLHNNFFLYEK